MIASIVLAATLAPSQAADPAAVKQAERLYAEAMILYKAGNYAAAAEKFESAYAYYPEPSLLYNLAKSYEGAGDVERALDRYRRYSDHPNSTAKLRVKASERIRLLESAVAASKEAQAAAPAPSAPATTTPAASTTPTAPAAGSAPAVTAAEEPSYVLAGVGYGAVAVGAATAIAGGVFYGLGVATHSSLPSSGSSELTLAKAAELNADGAQQKQMGVVLASAGAAVAALGVTLVVVDAASTPDAE